MKYIDPNIQQYTIGEYLSCNELIITKDPDNVDYDNLTAETKSK